MKPQIVSGEQETGIKRFARKGRFKGSVVVFLGMTFLPNLSPGQDWYYPQSATYLTGQKPARLDPLQIINSSKNPWGSKSVIEISLPEGFYAEWDVENVQVFYKGRKYTPQVEVYADKTIRITRVPRVLPGRIIKIENLRLKNFQRASNYKPLIVKINGKKGNPVASYNQLIRWRDRPRLNRYLNPVTRGYRNIRSYFLNALIYVPVLNPPASKGSFRIATLGFDLNESLAFITGADRCVIPLIEIRNDSLQSILKRGATLTILFPKGISLRKNKLLLSGQNKRFRYKYIDDNKIEVKLRKSLRTKETITLPNIEIIAGRKIVKPQKIKIKWQLSTRKNKVVLLSGNSIRIGNPKVRLSRDIELIANNPAVMIPDVIIQEGQAVVSITKGNNIYLEIPKKIEVFWGSDLSRVRLTGPGAKKVKAVPYFENKKLLKLEVTENFQPKDVLRIKNLMMYAVKRSADDIKTSQKDLKLPLNVHFDKLENGAVRLPKQLIKIVEVNIVSLADQVFLPGDDYEDLNPIRISLNSDFNALKAGDRLRLSFPEQFGASWDLGLRKVKITGKSKNKISPLVGFDLQRYPNSLILTVKENFNGDQEFELHGLSIAEIKEPSKGRLKLFLNDNPLPLAEDSVIWIIQYPLFTAAEDQIIFDNAQTSEAFSFRLNTRHLTKYFTEGKSIELVIPTRSPLAFNVGLRKLHLTGAAKLYLDENINYPSEKRARITIKRQIPPKTELIISGLEYGKPKRLTTTPDTVFCSIDGGQPFPCKNTFEVVSKKSEYKQAEFYYKVIKSNFREGDTLFFSLTGGYDMEWDTDYIQKNLRFVHLPASGGLKTDTPIFLNENKVLGFLITKTWGAEDYLWVVGLRIKRGVLPSSAYLTLGINNLYGPQTVTLRYPVNLGRGSEVLERTVPRFLKESYTSPIIKLLNENEKKELLSLEDRRYCILPSLEIVNGKLSPEDHNTYSQFTSDYSVIENALKRYRANRNIADLEKANQRVDQLIKISPNTWLGYYKKAEILKERGEFLSQSITSYNRAKELGFIPNKLYPPLYLDNINDQAMADIQRAEEMMEGERYVEAEKVLKTVLTYPDDSLQYEIKGTAYYLLGDIALELQDCMFAEDYLYQAGDYGVTNPAEYDLLRAQDRLQMCYDKDSDTDTTDDYLPILPPVADAGASRPDMKISLVSSLQYPFPVVIENVNETALIKTRIGNEFALKSENIYRLSAHPIRSQLYGLGLTITIMSLFIGAISL